MCHTLQTGDGWKTQVLSLGNILSREDTNMRQLWWRGDKGNDGGRLRCMCDSLSTEFLTLLRDNVFPKDMKVWEVLEMSNFRSSAVHISSLLMLIFLSGYTFLPTLSQSPFLNFKKEKLTKAYHPNISLNLHLNKRTVQSSGFWAEKVNDFDG